jgi:hypothetical protein
MEYKFYDSNSGTSTEVTILGTDGELGYVTDVVTDGNNNFWYLVYMNNPEAVYPYKGNYRLYPEWMLECVSPS